jgi:hypothetical protein
MSLFAAMAPAHTGVGARGAKTCLLLFILRRVPGFKQQQQARKIAELQKVTWRSKFTLAESGSSKCIDGRRAEAKRQGSQSDWTCKRGCRVWRYELTPSPGLAPVLARLSEATAHTIDRGIDETRSCVSSNA